MFMANNYKQKKKAKEKKKRKNSFSSFAPDLNMRNVKYLRIQITNWQKWREISSNWLNNLTAKRIDCKIQELWRTISFDFQAHLRCGEPIFSRTAFANRKLKETDFGCNYAKILTGICSKCEQIVYFKERAFKLCSGKVHLTRQTKAHLKLCKFSGLCC